MHPLNAATANPINLPNTQDQSTSQQPPKERKKLNPKKEAFKPKSAPNSTKNSMSFGQTNFFPSQEPKEESKTANFTTQSKINNGNSSHDPQTIGMTATNFKLPTDLKSYVQSNDLIIKKL